MRHGSLFSGIGGFDLAAQWMGWSNVFHVERDAFCQRVLRHHFPLSESYEDIKKFDGTAYAGRVDIISGGFPCQPFSAAGKRGGTSDDRYLWPEMFRVIRQARPAYVVAENVRGLGSWQEGLVLDTVCADLEGEGYEVVPVVLPAASVNAPHRRDRIWIVAYSNDKGGGGGPGQVQGTHGEVPQRDHHAEPCHTGAADASNAKGGGVCGDSRELRQAHRRQNNELHAKSVEYGATRSADATNADSNVRPQGRMHATRPKETARHVGPRSSPPISWEDFPSVAPLCGGDDGLPTRLDGITFSKWRRESIKAYGNAIVPQVALQIFRAIEKDVQGSL